MGVPEFYRASFRSSPGLCCMFDGATKIVFDANENFIKTLRAASNYYGQPLSVLDVVHDPALRANFDSVIGSFQSHHEFPGMEAESKDGTKLIVRWRLTDFHDNNSMLLSGEIVLPEPEQAKAETEQYPNVPYTRDELIGILDTAPIGFHCISAGNVAWANRTLLDILGFTAEEYIGQPVIKRFADLKAMFAVMQRCHAGERVSGFANNLIASDGSVVSLLGDAATDIRPDGSKLGRIFMRQNVDALVDEAIANERVQRVTELAAEREAFIRIIFHEIKTPLHNLSLAFNHFERESKLPSKTLNDFKYQIDSCSGMVEDLSFATMFESDQVLHPRPVNIALRRELDMIMEGLSHEMDVSTLDIRIERRIDAGMPELLAVDRSVLRVMSNLLSNALKYCCTDGAVTIEMGATPLSCEEEEEDEDKKEGYRLSFAVSNSVREPLDLVKVNRMFQNCFNRFRTSSTQERKPKCSPRNAIAQSLVSSDGLGLGVFVAYNVIQSLGGLLECSGDAHTARFAFTLQCGKGKSSRTNSAEARRPPALQLQGEAWSDVASSSAGNKHVLLQSLSVDANIAEHMSVAKRRSSSVGEKSHLYLGSGVKRPRVLVVDDSPICRKVLGKLLEANGFAPEYACDGQEACDAIMRVPLAYHLVLMDLRMPIMDGITATRRCRELARLAGLPIVIVTAETGEDVKQAAMDAKATHFVSKPVKLNELLDVMDRFVADP